MFNKFNENTNKIVNLNPYKKRKKDWRWFIYLFFALIFAAFLIGGAYYAIFVDYWYIGKTEHKSELLNFDFLISFLSVQVNLITIIWMFLLVFKKSTKNKIATTWYRAIINMNLLMFTIFWAGIIIELFDDFSMLSAYKDSQIACTIVTHFICPLFLLIMYYFEPNKQKLKFKNAIVSWDFLIAYIYLIIYICFVFIRASIYENFVSIPYYVENFVKWPYFFINFDEPLIGDSWINYLIMIIIVFTLWTIVNELIIIILNNVSYKKQQKNKWKKF